MEDKAQTSVNNLSTRFDNWVRKEPFFFFFMCLVVTIVIFIVVFVRYLELYQTSLSEVVNWKQRFFACKTDRNKCDILDLSANHFHLSTNTTNAQINHTNFAEGGDNLSLMYLQKNNYIFNLIDVSHVPNNVSSFFVLSFTIYVPIIAMVRQIFAKINCVLY